MKAKYVLFACVAATGSILSGATAEAAVILNSATGPVASAGNVYNFDTIGTAGWVYFGQFANPPGYEKSGMNDRFSAMTSNGTLNGTDPAAADYAATKNASIKFTGAVVPSGNPGTSAGTNDATTRAASAAGTTSGRRTVDNGSGAAEYISFSFIIGASHESVSLYVNSKGSNSVNLTVSDGAELYNSGTVSLPSPAAGFGSGIFTFDLTGSTIGDTVTFVFSSVGAGDIVVQGASTAEVVPEPAGLTLAAASAMGVLMRRRRTTP